MENKKLKIRVLLALIANLAWVSAVSAGDEWMSWPSTYTHDVYGQRVDQFAQPVAPLAQRPADFQRSGYRNYRSTLQAGNSADNIHIVEQWGAPVQPYESWRFPFRPYGSPYPAWGPPTPYGLFNGNVGASPYPGQYPPGVHPGTPNQSGQYPGGQYPGGQYPGGQYPGGNYPGGYGGGYGNASPSNGFPLTPPYQNQPWYDGTYPAAPPLDSSSDRDFFYKPTQ